MMMSGGDPREELGGVVDDDTIAAVATAAGRSALAVVRVSGRDAFAVVGRVVRPWPLTPRRATLGAVHDPASGELLERPLVTAYPAPKSYTGEDVVELTTHGGVVAPAAVLAALIAAGAREALPGEFTRRAVLRGKLDLAQAEAIGDLIDARTQAMRRAALSQLDGGLSRRIQALRDALLHVEALVAYDVDFPGEDDGPIAPARVQAAAADALAQIDRLLATAPAGEIVRDGAVVVIAGPPNAGKSSLFNALLGEARAIVTDVPGTTRDAIEAVIESATPTLGGWPLRLVDTAGLRSADDLVERLGIEVSERWLRRAHVVLACGEWPADVATTAARVRTLTDAPIVGVRTKGDRAGGADAGGAHAGEAHAGGAHAGEARAGEARGTTAGVEVGAGRGVAEGVGAPPERHDGAGREEVRHPLRAAGADAPPGEAEVVAPVVVSAERGDGLSELLARVGAVVAERYGAPSVDVPLLTRARHRRALEAARAELVSFLGAWTTGALPASIAAVHLHAAVEELATIIGAVDVEEVLGRVFGEFCVGK